MHDSPIPAAAAATAPRPPLLHVEAPGVVSAAALASGIPVVVRVAVGPVGSARLEVVAETADGPLCRVAVRAVEIPAEGETAEGEAAKAVAVELVLDPSAVLADSEDAAASIRVRLLSTTDGELLAETTSELTLLAPSRWIPAPLPLALELLAAHVQPQAPAIDGVLDDARERLDTATDSPALDGYSRGQERLDATIEAVLASVRALDLTRDHDAPAPSTTDAAGIRLRSAQEVLVGGVGSDLDIALAVAAVLEAARLRPVVLVAAGTAVVGVWRAESSLSSPAHLETAELVNLLDLDVLRLLPASSVTAFVDEHDVVDVRPLLLEEAGVLGLLDVRQARRSRIRPLPVRIESADGSVSIVRAGADDRSAEVGLTASAPETTVDAPAGATSGRRIPARVTAWKNSLLDLSLRNRLIDLPARARFPLAVPEGELAAFEDLVAGGTSIRLLASDDVPAVERERGVLLGRDRNPATLAEAIRAHHVVHTDVPTDAFPAKLRALAYKARTTIEETGANTLHLALGSLVWSVDGTTLRSPLVLVPVTIVSRGRAATGFSLALDETGASTPNYCLLEKLRTEFGVTIPGLAEPAEDEDGIDLDRALHAVREAIADAGITAHVENTVDLAILQFAKFRLWKDLDENWRVLARNPLVRHLIESPTSAFEDPAAVPSASDLDDLLARLPLPADSSQLEAIDAANAGRTFVLEGPPGTGKSQTITNLLATAIADGRRVLFVAEKRAALEVVQRRLGEVGLDPFVLDLHDKGSRPSTIRARLTASLAATARVDAEDVREAAEALDASRRSLSRYASRLHEPNAAGIGFYAAHLAELAGGSTASGVASSGVASSPPRVPISQEAAGSLDAASVARIRAVLRAAPDTADRARPSAHHPWGFVDLPAPADAPESDAAVDSALLDDIAARVRALDAAIDAVRPSDALTRVLLTASDRAHLDAIAIVAGEDSVPADDVAASRTTAWREETEEMSHAISRLTAAFADVLAVYTPGVAALDALTIDAAVREAEESFVLGRGKRRAAAAAPLLPALRPGVDTETATTSAMTARLVEMSAAVAALRERVDRIPGLRAGAGWNPLHEPDAAAVQGQVRRLAWLAQATAPVYDAPALTSDSEFRDALSDYATTSRTADPAVAAQVTAVAAAVKLLVDRTSPDGGAWSRWLAGRSLLEAWIGSREGRDPELPGSVRLVAWLAWTAALEPLRALGVPEVYDAVRSGSVSADDAVAAFDRSFATAVREERALGTGLDAFDGRVHDRALERFTESSERLRGLAPHALPAAALAARDLDDGDGRFGLLTRQLERKRGGMSVRELMASFGDLVTRITPCVLTSPDSVARFFPADGDTEPLFDLVVFDEASQVRVADAVGAMGRARSVIVVGDSKQMPPTTFAEAGVGGGTEDGAGSGLGSGSEFDDENGVDAAVLETIVDDEESILSECVQARVERRWLSWHYRSRDESLIAFSNRHSYDGRLTSFPAPSRPHSGVSLRRVDGTFIRSGSGPQLRTNPVEAEAIVTEIRERFAASQDAGSPDAVPSIGVVTFNAPQRTLIEALLREDEDPRLGAALDDPASGLLVKNLENVQGDERDTILFSTAFSPNAKGVLPLTFGPLARFGGERRLNVAITRARREVIVFSSFDPEQLRADRTSSIGLAHLRAYVEFARDGAGVGSGSGAGMGTSTGTGTGTDRHREDIAAALRSRGLVVTTDVGMSDFRIDLAVAHPDAPADPVLAILLDGPSWAARRTVADRDGLPVEVLSRGMGWPAVERVWLPDWLADRSAVLATIEEMVDRVSPDTASAS